MADLRKAKLCTASERTAELHLLAQNTWILVNFGFDTEAFHRSAPSPSFIRNDATMRPWWKKVDVSGVPQATSNVRCWHLDVYSTPRNAVTIRLFVNLMMDFL